MHLTVTPVPSESIQEVAHAICALANRTQFSVVCVFNIVRLMAHPDGSPAELVSDYHAEDASTSQYKAAYTGREPTR